MVHLDKIQAMINVLHSENTKNQQNPATAALGAILLGQDINTDYYAWVSMVSIND